MKKLKKYENLKRRIRRLTCRLNCWLTLRLSHSTLSGSSGHFFYSLLNDKLAWMSDRYRSLRSLIMQDTTNSQDEGQKCSFIILQKWIKHFLNGLEREGTKSQRIRIQKERNNEYGYAYFI